jgi:hypothetical protein
VTLYTAFTALYGLNLLRRLENIIVMMKRQVTTAKTTAPQGIATGVKK